jgi:hypothetical protein
MGALHVAGPSDHFMEFINIFVNSSGPLEVSQGFEISSCHLDLILGAKLADELLYERLPCIVGEASDHLVVSHIAIDELSSTVIDPRVS